MDAYMIIKTFCDKEEKNYNNDRKPEECLTHVI